MTLMKIGRTGRILGLLSCLAVASGARGETAPQMPLQGVLYITLDDKDIQTFSDSFLRLAEKEGWKREGNTFYTVVPVRDAKLVTDDGSTKTISAGNVSDAKLVYSNRPDAKMFSASPDGEAMSSALEWPKLSTAKGLLPLYAARDKSGKLTLRLNQSLSNHDCCAAGATASLTTPTPQPHNDPRCLDYNGPESDGVNYSKIAEPAKAFRNFVGSDCAIAMGRGHCFLDHVSESCYSNHGGKICSELIGHPTTYHKH